MKNKAYASILAAVICGALTLTGCSGGSSSTPPPQTVTIAATSGSAQHAGIGTAFAAPLVATVSKGGTPMSGATVTFTAPASGASGTFSGATATETDTTDANGVATSSTFTANSTAGSYSVTASVAGASASASFSLTNDGPVSYYTFSLSGLETINPSANPNFYSLAGVVSVDASGNVVGGEQDYNDGFGITSPQPGGDTITGGTLTVDSTTGQGTLTVITDNVNLGPSAGTETFAVQFVNTDHALISQFDGSATSSGSMDLQATPSTPSGPFAFTLSGVDSGSSPMAFGGVFTVAGGNITSGTFDVNDNGTVTLASTLTGTVGAPDAFGRGKITSAALGLSLVYYTVGPQVARVIDVDTADEAVGSLYGQGSGSFSAASLGTSVFGIESNADGTLFAAAGMLTTNPGTGKFTGVGDNDDVGIVVSGSTISGTYSIGSDGYGSLTMTSGFTPMGALGLYMTDPSLNLSDPNSATGGGGALVLDLDPASGLAGTGGVLIPQTDVSTASFAGNYAIGVQDYNGGGVSGSGWEFDLVGQGSVASGVLTSTGMLSDPFGVFDIPTLYTGVPVSATITADTGHPGRYTMPVDITAPSGTVNPFSAVAYQASGDMLFWLDEDASSLWLGPIEQQGSLAGLPAAKAGSGTAKLKGTRRR